MIFCTFTARQSGKYAVYRLRHRFCSAFRKQNKQFSEWPKKGTVKTGEPENTHQTHDCEQC